MDNSVLTSLQQVRTNFQPCFTAELISLLWLPLMVISHASKHQNCEVCMDKSTKIRIVLRIDKYFRSSLGYNGPHHTRHSVEIYCLGFTKATQDQNTKLATPIESGSGDTHLISPPTPVKYRNLAMVACLDDPEKQFALIVKSRKT